MATFVESDKERFLNSVDIDATNLELATPEMLNDPNVIMRGVYARENGDKALFYASDRLKSDPQFVRGVLLVKPGNWTSMDPELFADPDIVYAAAISSSNPMILRRASAEIQRDDKFVINLFNKCMQDQYDVISYMLGAMWQNKNIVKYAKHASGKKMLTTYAAKIAENCGQDVEIMESLVDIDFTHSIFVPEEAKASSPRLQEASEKCEAFTAFVRGDVKVKDLDKKYFADEEFYSRVCEEYEDRLKDIAAEALEIEHDNALVQGVKRFMFSTQQKMSLAKLAAYKRVAERNKLIQKGQEQLAAIKAKLKAAIEGVLDSSKKDSSEQEIK